MGLDTFRWRPLFQSRQHIEDVLGTGPAGFEDQIHGNEHGLQTEARDRRQHLRHHAVAALTTQQRTAELLQRHRQLGKRGAVSERTGLTLNERQVVLPVVDNVIAV